MDITECQTATGHAIRAEHDTGSCSRQDQGAAQRHEVEVAVVIADVATDHLRKELGRGAAHGEEDIWDREEGEER